MSEPRTESGRDLIAHIERLYDRVEAPNSGDVAAFYGWLISAEQEAAAIERRHMVEHPSAAPTDSAP